MFDLRWNLELLKPDLGDAFIQSKLLLTIIQAKAVNSGETNELVLLYIQNFFTYQCSAMLKGLCNVNNV